MKILPTHFLALTAFVAATTCDAGDRFPSTPILIMPAPTLGESALVLPSPCPIFDTEPVYAARVSQDTTWDSQHAAESVTTRFTAVAATEPATEFEYVVEVHSDDDHVVVPAAASETASNRSPFNLFGIVVLALGVIVWVGNLRR